MKIKGHAKIELTDVRTGEKVIHEKDNVVTDFTQEFFKDCGGLSWNPLEGLDKDCPLDDLFGGIMCFDDEIDYINGKDDTGKYKPMYVPSGVNMIANGACDFTADTGTSTQAGPTELGQYDADHSGMSADKRERTYVYKWDTDEGLGTIASVCLTSRIGGYIGSGNASSNISNFGPNHLNRKMYSYNSPVDTEEVNNLISKQRSIATETKKRLATIDLTRGQAAVLTGGGTDVLENSLPTECFARGKVYIDWYDLPVKNLNPFVSRDQFDHTILKSREHWGGSAGISINSYNVAGARVVGGIGHITLIGCSTAQIQSNSTLYVAQISKNTDLQTSATTPYIIVQHTYSVGSLTYKQGGTTYNATFDLTNFNQCCYGKIMDNGDFYFGGTINGTSFVMNFYIKYNGGSNIFRNLTNIDLHCGIHNIVGGRIILSDTRIYDPALDTDNSVEPKVLVTNATSLSTYSSYSWTWYNVGLHQCYDSYTMMAYNSQTGSPSVSPLSTVRPMCVWLSTIDNLDEPIVKDGNHSMTITYTLSLVD